MCKVEVYTHLMAKEIEKIASFFPDGKVPILARKVGVSATAARKWFKQGYVNYPSILDVYLAVRDMQPSYGERVSLEKMLLETNSHSVFHKNRSPKLETTSGSLSLEHRNRAENN